MFLASHQRFIYESQGAVSQHERGRAKNHCNQSKMCFSSEFTTPLTFRLRFTIGAMWTDSGLCQFLLGQCE